MRRLIKVPDQSRLLAAGASPTENPKVQVTFPESGWIVGAVFDTRQNDGTAIARSACEVKLQTLGQQTALTTDGETDAYAPLVSLMGSAATTQVWPLVRKVRSNDSLWTQFRNVSPDLAINPFGGFFFLRDSDLPPGYRPGPVNSTLPACTRVMVDPRIAWDATLPSGTTGQAEVWQVKWDAWVTGFRFGLANDDGSGLGSIDAMLEVLGGECALTASGQNGGGSDFAPLPLLNSGESQFLRIVRKVKIDDLFRTYYRNVSLTTDFQPRGALFLRCDVDVKACSLTSG